MKHVWNKTQLKALRASILHWERMLEDEEGDTGPLQCSCCIEYNSAKNDPSDCMGCPIYQFTKKQYCYGTPYWAAVDAEEIAGDMGSPDFKSSAQKMINFMNKVLKAGSEQ